MYNRYPSKMSQNSLEVKKNKYDEMEEKVTFVVDQESLIDSFIEAAFHGNMKKLLEFTTNMVIDCKNSKQETPLIAATMGGQTRAVFFLLAKGANGSLLDATGNSALHHAVIMQNLDIIDKLSNKCDLNVKNSEGQTILHVAVKENKLKALNHIIRIPGLNLNEEDINGDTACHIAVKNKNSLILSKLLELPTDLTLYNNDGKNVLNLAVENDDLESLKMMLQTKSGAYTLPTKTLYGESNLEIAIREKHSSIVSYLIQPQRQPETMISCEINKKYGATSLHWAVLQIDLDLVEKLIHINPKLLNVKDRLGKTPLDHICSIHGLECLAKEQIVDIAITLITEGADMNLIQNKTGLFKLIKDTFQLKFKS